MTTPSPTIDSPDEEYVFSIVALPGTGQSSARICYAARTSGLYRSDDGGSSWKIEATPISSRGVTSIIFSPDFEKDHSIFTGATGGLFRSENGGQNWQWIALPSPPPTITTLIISPNFVQDGVLLAGTLEDGVFCSSDRGGHWSAWNFGLLDLSILCMAISPNFSDDETIYVGTESGMFRSTNGGRAWREVDLPIGFEPVISLAISPRYAFDHALFIGPESQGLFSSLDEGHSWQRLGGKGLTGPINSILLSPGFSDPPEILVLTNNGVLISRDFGKSWTVRWGEITANHQVTAVTAPDGFDSGKKVWLGLAGGDIRQVTVS